MSSKVLAFFAMLCFFLVETTARSQTPLSTPSPINQAAKTDVTITAGDVNLAATLYRPAGAQGDLPAVVLSHGSGPVTRQLNGFWTTVALRTGIAVLVFDKRGTGASTGTFERFEVKKSPEQFKNLASDLVYSARWLATQPGIDKSRIGLMGGSQAGWIMPLAASQEPLIRFIVAGCGVPLPTGIEAAHENYLISVTEPKTRPTLRQIHDADAFAMDYKRDLGFNPAPILENLTIPVFWIFGLYDDVIPTNLSIERIGELQKAGKKNHHIHVFPFSDHNFRNVFTGEGYDVAEASRNWLRQIGIMN